MNTVEEYFARVRQLFQNIADAQAERYEEHLLSATRGNLRIRLRFSDNALLEMSEAIVRATLARSASLSRKRLVDRTEHAEPNPAFCLVDNAARLPHLPTWGGTEMEDREGEFGE